MKESRSTYRNLAGRTFSNHEVEMRLRNIIKQQGKGIVEKLRKDAATISAHLDMQSEFKSLSRLIDKALRMEGHITPQPRVRKRASRIK